MLLLFIIKRREGEHGLHIIAIHLEGSLQMMPRAGLIAQTIADKTQIIVDLRIIGKEFDRGFELLLRGGQTVHLRQIDPREDPKQGEILAQGEGLVEAQPGLDVFIPDHEQAAEGERHAPILSVGLFELLAEGDSLQGIPLLRQQIGNLDARPHKSRVVVGQGLIKGDRILPAVLGGIEIAKPPAGIEKEGINFNRGLIYCDGGEGIPLGPAQRAERQIATLALWVVPDDLFEPLRRRQGVPFLKKILPELHLVAEMR
ncbi:MAG: hypothetical protein BWY77_00990 [bacterium ADurb.Bin431]|nr:MAG: hypothetical protein BWY77_00990 [bacterium ADurb.Bin431]